MEVCDLMLSGMAFHKLARWLKKEDDLGKKMTLEKWLYNDNYIFNMNIDQLNCVRAESAFCILSVLCTYQCSCQGDKDYTRKYLVTD